MPVSKETQERLRLLRKQEMLRLRLQTSLAQSKTDMGKHVIRPYNSIRFICRCGRKHYFPVARGNRQKHSTKDDKTETLADGTKKQVTATEKIVVCPCGVTTSKQRRDFKGR